MLEWMTDFRQIAVLVLALLVLLCLLRAVQLIRRRRKGQDRLSADKNLPDSIEQAEQAESVERANLPGGGAVATEKHEADGNAAPSPGKSAKAPARGAAAEQQDIPLLLDPVSVASAEAVAEPAARTGELNLGQVAMTAGEPIGTEVPAQARSPSPGGRVQRRESFGEGENPAAEQQQVAESPSRGAKAPQPGEAESSPASDQPDEQESSASAGELNPDKILSLHVVARSGKQFTGRELWNLLHEAGLQHDQMKIFSKTQDSRPDSPVIFRVANLVNPGTFDADAIDAFTTPGVSLFLLLPTPIDNLLAFEQMLALAKRFVATFEGDLLGADRQELTEQAIDDARRQIREFDANAPTPTSTGAG